jgi:hypothetical protein
MCEFFRRISLRFAPVDADLQRHPRCAPALRRIVDDRHIPRDAEFVHRCPQQIRGNCSPTSMSTMRRPPKTVRIVTRPGSPC